MPAEVVFVANALRDFQPALADRLEEEVRAGIEAAEESGRLECRIAERHENDRALIQVHIEGTGWAVSFAVTEPAAGGEIRVETRRALRDRTRRNPYYRRSTRR